jgi:MerR family redox-sensitive transcriptional activator SoxR
MGEMSISEVKQATGIPPSTLRYYEEVGLVCPIRRVGGKRHYDESVVQRLALIQTGQQAGFTLAELRTLLDDVLGSDEGAGWHGLVERKLKEMDTLMRNIESMKRLLTDIMDCDSDSVAECIVQTGQRHSQDRVPDASKYANRDVRAAQR